MSIPLGEDHDELLVFVKYLFATGFEHRQVASWQVDSPISSEESNVTVFETSCQKVLDLAFAEGRCPCGKNHLQKVCSNKR